MHPVRGPEVDDPGQRHDARDPALAGPRLPGRPGDELSAGGVTDEDERLGQVGLRRDRREEVAHVVEGAGDAATRHTDSAVLREHDVVAGRRERLGLGARVLPVVLLTPEAAVDDDHRAGSGGSRRGPAG